MKRGSNSGGLAEKIHLGLASVRPLEHKLWAKQEGQLLLKKPKIEPRSHSLALENGKNSALRAGQNPNQEPTNQVLKGPFATCFVTFLQPSTQWIEVTPWEIIRAPMQKYTSRGSPKVGKHLGSCENTATGQQQQNGRVRRP